MKSITFAIILSVFSAAVSADQSWFVADRNTTCTGHDTDGSITCERGHVSEAPLNPYAAAPAIRGREANPLDKRVSCSIPLLGGSSCFAHCFALGYCNSYCDQGICKCKCYDESTFLGGIDVCHKTTCH
ncbi:hypothetical protein QBC47DRAFT_293518 [Echria macrotheca]|uniref:Invertebrate defensins family profile domain-containing protein n=1 Tax=Echria macrotheca TaxID=438768 RepID=A0AAJ0FEH1_9PEZI|nr:hypothetical protein QBC47DRAFT_293518 [Echria macrotheca]